MTGEEFKELRSKVNKLFKLVDLTVVEIEENKKYQRSQQETMPIKFEDLVPSFDREHLKNVIMVGEVLP